MNDKIKYEKPEIEIIDFVSEDVIAKSNETDGFIIEG